MKVCVSRLQNMLAKAMGTWPVEPIFRQSFLTLLCLVSYESAVLI